MPELTRNELRYVSICEILIRCRQERHRPPNLDQLAEQLGLKSRSSVQKFLEAMGRRYGSGDDSLVDKSGGGVHLLPLGERVYQDLRVIRDSLVRLNRNQDEVLNIACSETFWAHVIPHVKWRPLPPILFKRKSTIERISQREIHIAVVWNKAYEPLPYTSAAEPIVWPEFDTNIHSIFVPHDSGESTIHEEQRVAPEALSDKIICYPKLPLFHKMVSSFHTGSTCPLDHLPSVFHFVASSKGSAVGLMPHYPNWLYRSFGRGLHLQTAELDLPTNKKGVIGVMALKAKHLSRNLSQEADSFLEKFKETLSQLDAAPGRWKLEKDSPFLSPTFNRDWRVYFTTNRRKGKRVLPSWKQASLKWDSERSWPAFRGTLTFSTRNSCRVNARIEDSPPCWRIEGIIKTDDDYVGHASAYVSCKVGLVDSKSASIHCYVGILSFDTFQLPNAAAIVISPSSLELTDGDKNELLSFVRWLH